MSDPQKELVDPALIGTRNVLGAANRTSSVRRVVLTSSCAAIYTDNVDVAEAPGGVLTEAIWNESASLSYQPYSYSKTVAERAAWEIAVAQSRWRLVAVNPALVMGPGTRPGATSESFSIMRQMGDGTFRLGVPRIGVGVVDVRDVAAAHVAAGFLPDAEGRHIVSGHDTDFLEIARLVSERFGDDWPVPRRALPKWLVWLVGPLANRTLDRRFVARTVDLPWHADNGRSVRLLGMRYRPLRDTVQEMFGQMAEAGAFRRA